jgi:hypothetical protein
VIYGQREVLEALSEQLAELEHAHGERAALTERYRRDREGLIAEAWAAAMDLATAVLPALTPEALQQAWTLTGTPLLQEDRIAVREADRQRLSARLAEIDVDPRWLDRDRLRAPRVGTLVRKKTELEEFRLPHVELLQKAAHPRLLRLIETGYGTERYAIPFWRWSYYQDWKAGDEILERFPERKDFTALAGDLAQAATDLPVFDRQIDELEQEIAAGKALAKEREDVAEQLRTVDERHLGLARTRIAEFVGKLEHADLAERLAAPELAVLWRRASGMLAKIRYLDALQTELTTVIEGLQRDAQKTRLKIQKWARPRNAGAGMIPTEFRKLDVSARREKRRRILERQKETYAAVSGYRGWDRPDLVGDFLWWDVMTDGGLDGDFIPEVRSWREVHPPREREPWDRDDSAAAAATASAQETYESSRDPS